MPWNAIIFKCYKPYQAKPENEEDDGGDDLADNVASEFSTSTAAASAPKQDEEGKNAP